MSTSQHDRPGSVKSADRVLRILELFAARQQPLTLTHISQELGYPMSSVLALVKSLASTGYVRQDPDGKTYVPTLKVPMLGSWVMGELFQGGGVPALLDHIQKETGETVILGVQNGIHAQYLHTVQSQKLMRLYFIKPGLRRPMLKSAVGRALLMHFSDSELSDFVQQLRLEGGGDAALIDQDALRQEIKLLREQGYSYTDDLTPGICAIGLPLRLGHNTCAVAVAGPIFRLKRKQEKVVTAIRQLTSIYLSQHPVYKQL